MPCHTVMAPIEEVFGILRSSLPLPCDPLPGCLTWTCRRSTMPRHTGKSKLLHVAECLRVSSERSLGPKQVRENRLSPASELPNTSAEAGLVKAAASARWLLDARSRPLESRQSLRLSLSDGFHSTQSPGKGFAVPCLQALSVSFGSALLEFSCVYPSTSLRRGC